MDEPVVFDRLRQEGFSEFRRRPPAERAQSGLSLTFDGMTLAIPLCCER